MVLSGGGVAALKYWYHAKYVNVMSTSLFTPAAVSV